jgi:hypothetical protein
MMLRKMGVGKAAGHHILKSEDVAGRNPVPAFPPQQALSPPISVRSFVERQDMPAYGMPMTKAVILAGGLAIAPAKRAALSPNPHPALDTKHE